MAVSPSPLIPDAMAVLVDRKSTRLNSSHLVISYAVFRLKKKSDSHRERRSFMLVNAVHLLEGGSPATILHPLARRLSADRTGATRIAIAARLPRTPVTGP